MIGLYGAVNKCPRTISPICYKNFMNIFDISMQMMIICRCCMIKDCNIHRLMHNFHRFSICALCVWHLWEKLFKWFIPCDNNGFSNSVKTNNEQNPIRYDATSTSTYSHVKHIPTTNIFMTFCEPIKFDSFIICSGTFDVFIEYSYCKIKSNILNLHIHIILNLITWLFHSNSNYDKITDEESLLLSN